MPCAARRRPRRRRWSMTLLGIDITRCQRCGGPLMITPLAGEYDSRLATCQPRAARTFQAGTARKEKSLTLVHLTLLTRLVRWPAYLRSTSARPAHHDTPPECQAGPIASRRDCRDRADPRFERISTWPRPRESLPDTRAVGYKPQLAAACQPTASQLSSATFYRVIAAERNRLSQYTSSQAITLLALFPPVQKVRMLCLLPLAKVLPKTRKNPF
jgi:hypothetical protein